MTERNLQLDWVHIIEIYQMENDSVHTNTFHCLFVKENVYWSHKILFHCPFDFQV